ncbi:hypothetical protein DFR42_104101 [Undibacterium pigrum]|uniref:Uncharacterized protein n=1 Tax=Undibacterium pigrum TaxID=401470 RepID=A0A318J927_9BURK|nr:hypothetical protein DFR42_104101 [Undibacterium pigrum]
MNISANMDGVVIATIALVIISSLLRVIIA